MTASRPVRVVGLLYLVALGAGAVATCRPAGPVPPDPSPAPGPAAFEVDRAFIPVVLGWPATVPARTPTPTATATHRPASERDSLIASVVGVARVRGVDGAGVRGPACVVVSLERRGPGTLADCLSRPGRWITFARGGQVRLTDDLAVPSNTTIDARGAGVQLWGGGLVIDGAENVIIAGLAITEADADAVHVAGGSEGVFLLDLDLSHSGDGLLDVTEGATDVTLSGSTLRDHVKGVLIGASDSASGDWAIRVTIHNTIIATTYRHPMCRYAWVHLDRVTVGPWIGDAVDARYGCRVLITRSWFVPGGPKALRVAGRFTVPDAPGAVAVDDATDLGGLSAQVGGVVEPPRYGVLP